MKKTFTLTLLMLLMSLFCSVGLASMKGHSSATYLFLQHSQSGMITYPDNDGDCTTLTMKGLERIKYVSDQPVRKAGMISVSKFVKVFKSGGIEPNAFIIADKMTNKSGSVDTLGAIPIKLSSIKIDHAKKNLVYQICFIRKKDHLKSDLTLDSAFLFIDNFGGSGGL